ncbi:MAG: hypothetical protein O2805_03890 [Proteobacteria bacterium]|nr:hypothetical protein [Pseudomonadota bacterium]
MWLPSSVYERLPQFWMLVGILLICGAVYIGFDFSLSGTYLAVGMLSVVWSGCVMVLRARRRKGSESATEQPG